VDKENEGAIKLYKKLGFIIHTIVILKKENGGFLFWHMVNLPQQQGFFITVERC